MSTRLVPHTVYLPPEAHEKLKSYAQNRQSSTLLREAVMAHLHGSSSFEAGYFQALKDADKILSSNDLLNSLSYKERKISDIIYDSLNLLLENRNVPQQ